MFFIRHSRGYFISQSNNWKFHEILTVDIDLTDVKYIIPLDKTFRQNFENLEEDLEFSKRLHQCISLSGYLKYDTRSFF